MRKQRSLSFIYTVSSDKESILSIALGFYFLGLAASLMLLSVEQMTQAVNLI